MSENGGRGRWLSPAEAILEGLVDTLITERGESEMTKESEVNKTSEFAKRGVKALLRAIGIEQTKGAPNAGDDINYISRERTVENLGNNSTIAFEEAQRGAQATTSMLKNVEDPSPIEHKHNPRVDAYERDARSMRNR
jgi:hypothetical protein